MVSQVEYFLTINDDEIQTTTKVNEIETEDEGFHICFRIPIKALSDGIWEKIKQSIIVSKREYNNDSCNKRKWMSDGYGDIVFHYFVLSVWVDQNGISYNILCGFNDMEDELLEELVDIPIDLHRYDKEVRELVHQFIDDTFFMLVKE